MRPESSGPGKSVVRPSGEAPLVPSCIFLCLMNSYRGPYEPSKRDTNLSKGLASICVLELEKK